MLWTHIASAKVDYKIIIISLSVVYAVVVHNLATYLQRWWYRGTVKKVQHTNQWENMTQCKQPMRKHDTKCIENVEILKEMNIKIREMTLKQQIRWHHNTCHVKQPMRKHDIKCVEMAGNLAVLRIHDILVWIRIRIWIRGSMPLTNGSGSGCGSGSCYCHHWRFFLLYLLGDRRIRIWIIRFRIHTSD